jgi:nitroreductase
MTNSSGRRSNYPIDPIFLERWSPRAFTGESIDASELATMFEAARWAPSCYNSQPWRFIYARRCVGHWDLLLGLLNEFNRSWAQRAAALAVLVSRTTLTVPGSAVEVPSYSHSFDSGAAWASLALQATLSGWQAHAMIGFDREAALKILKVPKGHHPEAVIAIGRRGDPSLLPEGLAARERPGERRPLEEIAFEGVFPTQYF